MVLSEGWRHGNRCFQLRLLKVCLLFYLLPVLHPLPPPPTPRLCQITTTTTRFDTNGLRVNYLCSCDSAWKSSRIVIVRVPAKGRRTTRVARECLHVIDALSEWCGWVCEYNVSDCVKAFQFSAIVPGGAFYLFLTERRMVTQWKECVGVDDHEEVMLPSDKRRIVINC